MKEGKRIRGFLVERKTIGCEALNDKSLNCQGSLDGYFYMNTDTLAEAINCSNKMCRRHRTKIQHLNDGIKGAGEKK